VRWFAHPATIADLDAQYRANDGWYTCGCLNKPCEYHEGYDDAAWLLDPDRRFARPAAPPWDPPTGTRWAYHPPHKPKPVTLVWAAYEARRAGEIA
jgi:hypothetical protein